MDNDFVPYLCGGIFFSFLIELHNDTAKKYNDFQRSKTTIRQPEIMEGLIKAIHPNYSYDNHTGASTFRTKVSEYRTCRFNGGKVIPFERDYIKTEFDKSVKKQYKEVLKRMTIFTAECFPSRDDKAMRSLVERTLILIRDDNSIEDDAPFFINENGTSISKKNLMDKKDFCFQSFLVGVWHYIIIKPTKNQNGMQAFHKIFIRKNKEYELDTNCLKPYAHDINVTEIDASDRSTPIGNYNCADQLELSNGTREDKLKIEIYYECKELSKTDKEAILSNSSEIIDLNENPNALTEEKSICTIYKITSEFRYKTQFLPPPSREQILKLYCNIGSYNIYGCTSAENWKSKSYLNCLRSENEFSLTAWFRLTSNKNIVKYLMLGDLDK